MRESEPMYVPGHFAMTDEQALDAVERRGFGTVVVAHDGSFEATPLPWLLRRDGTDRLVGHLAAANPLVSLVGDGVPAMVLFDLLDGYVSPSWYPSKREHGRVVPTWNYVTVHVHGTLTVHRDAGWVRALVTELTDRHELPRAEPWAVTDAPDTYVQSLLRAIVGVELTIDRVVGKAKLSQNKSTADAAGVRDALTAAGAHTLAREMTAHAVEEETA
jgi:transcriptional regulator